MKTLLHALLFLCLTACMIPFARAQGSIDAKPLDAMVDKALGAYNAADHKTFHADFAKRMSSIATEQTFNAMYRGMYFKTYGAFLSRKPIKEQSVLLGETPLLVYSAEFEKNKKAKISVNFLKEDGVFKIMQIQFGPM